MECYFQGGPPNELHFLHNVPKVTVGIFISSSPGTSRAGGTPTPSQLIYFMPYYSPISWYPLPSLLMNILLHGREMSTALSRPHRQEGHQGPGGTGVQPGGRGEPEILSHWTILRGVHFMPWCFISGGSHGWLFEQEKFLSHPSFSFSPYSLSPHCPKRSTYRTHSQMLGKFEYTLPAKFWRLVGCTEMLSW